jgi:hypothetical protein
MLWISEHHRVITFASRHKHAGQLARHANEGDAPRDQCHIQDPAGMTVRKLRPVALANIKVATVYQRSERSFFSPIFAGVTENQS